MLPHKLNYITNRNITDLSFKKGMEAYPLVTFSLPYRYRLILQCLQPEPIDFVIPNQLLLSLY